MSQYLNKKHILSWLVGGLIMFLLSNLYHNVILNDFSRLLIPPPIFYTALIIAYLGISFLLEIIYESGRVKLGPHLSALTIGAFWGCTIYLITLTLGFNFNNSTTLFQSVLDFFWQILEQSLGGLAIAVTSQIIEKGGFYVHI